MEVAVSALRSELAGYLDRAKAGEDLVITARGVPVARLVGIGSASLVERLTAAGVLGTARSTERPGARGVKRIQVRRPVSDLVAEQRR